MLRQKRSNFYAQEAGGINIMKTFSVNELRENRAKAWEKAKNFLDSHRDENGMLSAEDVAAYEKMEA